jgi:transposase
MRPHGTQATLEARRRWAVALLGKGHTVTSVAKTVGCSHSSVIRWRDAVALHGPAILSAKPAPGGPAKLTVRQRQRIPALLRRGALRWGFRTDHWTTARIAAVIKREFGVRYHPTHVRRVLVQLGWVLPGSRGRRPQPRSPRAS